MSDVSPGRELNKAAQHDSRLYDPDVHDNQIVTMYESDTEASAARDALVQSGVPESAIHLVSRDSNPTLGGTNAEDGGGLWGAVASLFTPQMEQSSMSHAVGRGHSILVLIPEPGMDRIKAIHTLEATHPVDFDARLEEWRQAGYDSVAMHPDHKPTKTPRVGERETLDGAPRVRSYIADRG